jgi:uncharacterized protein (UPF0335 family)
MSDNPGIGHNSGVAVGQLKTLVERIERLDEEREAILDDIKNVYSEAKGNGFDVKTLRKMIRLRRKDPSKRREERELEDVYGDALGIWG